MSTVCLRYFTALLIIATTNVLSAYEQNTSEEHYFKCKYLPKTLQVNRLNNKTGVICHTAHLNGKDVSGSLCIISNTLYLKTTANEYYKIEDKELQATPYQFLTPADEIDCGDFRYYLRIESIIQSIYATISHHPGTYHVTIGHRRFMVPANQNDLPLQLIVDLIKALNVHDILSAGQIKLKKICCLPIFNKKCHLAALDAIIMAGPISPLP